MSVRKKARTVGNYYTSLSKCRTQASDDERHLGSVVDDKDTVAHILDELGVESLSNRFFDFLDPWGNRIEIVGYKGIQFTKAANVLRGMGLDDLEKNRQCNPGTKEKRHESKLEFWPLYSVNRRDRKSSSPLTKHSTRAHIVYPAHLRNHHSKKANILMLSQSNSPRTAARPGLFILIAMSAMGPVALNIFIPSMPGLQKALHTDYATAQLTLTLYLLSLAFSQLLMGPLSDRFGRRPVLLCGLALYVVASIYCTYAASIEQLIIGRILQAAGGCAGVTLSRAIVRDIYERDKAASLLGYVTMTMAIAPMLSPVIGGFLDQWAGWRAGFYLVSLLGLLVFLICFAKLPETNRNLTHSFGMAGLPRQYLKLLKNRVFLGYVFCMSFSSAIFFAFVSGAPFIVVEIMEMTPSDYGLYFIIISAGYMFGNFLTGRFSGQIGTNKMVLIGNSVVALGLSILALFYFLEVSGPLSIFAPMVLITLSNGLIIPNAMAGALSVQPDNVGAASGLAGFCQVGIGALATRIVGLLHDGTVTPTISVMIGAGVLSIFFFQFVRYKRQQVAPPDGAD